MAESTPIPVRTDAPTATEPAAPGPVPPVTPTSTPAGDRLAAPPTPGARSRFRHAARSWAGRTGLASRLRRPADDAPVAVILMYHAILDAENAPWIDPANAMSVETFAAQADQLAATGAVRPLSDIVGELATDGRVRRPSIAITFDDGYLDNRRLAGPILARHRLPATLFVCPGVIEDARPQWIDRLHVLVRAAGPGAVAAAMGLQGAEVLPPATAARALARYLLELVHDDREASLLRAETALRPPEMPRLTLTAPEVAAMAAGGDAEAAWTIGSHGHRHVDLSRVDADELQREIAGSRDALAGLLGAAPTLFSYPYGRRSGAAEDAVRTAGYHGAVIADAEHDAGPGTDPARMPRREAPADPGAFRWTIAPAMGGSR